MGHIEFTAGVQFAVTEARREAARFNHAAVQPEHILLAMLRLYWSMFSKLRVEPEALQKRLVSMLEPGDRTVADPAAIPFSEDAELILRLARVEARLMQDRVLFADHILLALVTYAGFAQSAAAQVLRSAPVHFHELRNQVVANHRVGKVQGGTRRLPTVEELKREWRQLSPDEYSVAIVADLHAVPISMLVEVMSALDALHRAWGGGGLVVEGDRVASLPTHEVVHS